MKKRLFFAIALPQQTKRIFAQFVEKVGGFTEVKWEKPEKLHLTLAFLGFVAEHKIKTLATILGSIIVEQESLNLTILPKLCAFPTISNPRVFWLPIGGEIDKLEAVSQHLTKILMDKRFTFDDRPFSVHITLGRFRKAVKKWQKQKLVKVVQAALPKNPIAFQVKGITLFDSKLTSKGSVYQVLAYENFRH